MTGWYLVLYFDSSIHLHTMAIAKAKAELQLRVWSVHILLVLAFFLWGFQAASTSLQMISCATFVLLLKFWWFEDGVYDELMVGRCVSWSRTRRLIGLAHMVDSADEVWMKCLNYPCNQFYFNHCCVNCECDDADGCLFGRMEHIARDNYLFEELVPIILEIQIQNFKWIFHFFDLCMYLAYLYCTKEIDEWNSLICCFRKLSFMRYNMFDVFQLFLFSFLIRNYF